MAVHLDEGVLSFTVRRMSLRPSLNVDDISNVRGPSTTVTIDG